MKVGEAVLKGTEIRSALGLSSALFTISFKEGTGWKGSSDTNTQIIFVSSGSGHGVGMSQYGANCLALNGEDYGSILKYFFFFSELAKFE